MRNSLIRSIRVVAAAAVLVAGCAHTDAANSDAGTQRGAPGGGDKTYATTAQVLDAVKAAQNLTALPESLTASLTKDELASPQAQFDCEHSDHPKAQIWGNCAYGAENGTKLMVLYGDSHALMWAATLEGVAAKAGWKLRVFGEGGCPLPDLQFISEQTNSPNTLCDEFRAAAVPAINALHPQLVIATSGLHGAKLVSGDYPTDRQWLDGWTSTLSKLAQPGTRLAVIGMYPNWPNNSPRCLSAHLTSVQECSVPTADARTQDLGAEQTAASAAAALYIPTTPWICADRCEPVIADTRVYNDEYHFTQSYTVYLTGALGEALQPAMT